MLKGSTPKKGFNERIKCMPWSRAKIEVWFISARISFFLLPYIRTDTKVSSLIFVDFVKRLIIQLHNLFTHIQALLKLI